MTFVQTFGGTNIYSAEPSYRSIALTANVTLSWPIEMATDENVVANIMDVTPNASGRVITMPPANQVSVGQTALFFNVGSFTFTVNDNAGNAIVSVAPGLAWQVYLTDNSTVAGTWRTVQFGAGSSSATAGALTGYGIVAIANTLNQAAPVSNIAVNYSIGLPDRAGVINWTGGAGTFTLPSASTCGNNWFVLVRNSGNGAITLATPGGETINGDPTMSYNPGDSAIVICDGADFYTVGFGQAPEYLFDYVSINLTGETSPYILSGANLNRIAYNFTGTLLANMVIQVPNTIQQYWVSNQTTGAYTLALSTSGGTPAEVTQGARAILYCDGTNVYYAQTGGLALPITISQGGTGATNISSARTNLGATSVGTALFTAVSASSAFNTISPITTTGDLIVGTGTNSSSRLGIGAASTVLSSNGTTASWQPVPGYLATEGQVEVSATGTLSSTVFGNNVLVTTAGITVTFPSGGSIVGGTTIALKNVSAGPVTLAYAFDSDGVTTLYPGQSAAWIADGNSSTYWRMYWLSVAPAAATTFTNTQTFNGSTSAIAAVAKNIIEPVTVSATAATGTIPIYPSTQSVLYYTTNSSANFTVNLTWGAATTMNTALSTGQAVTVAFMVTNGATAYYNNVVQVDGSTSGVTTKWQGGIAPASGNASSIDIYTYTVIKTGSATFTVLASQTKFA